MLFLETNLNAADYIADIYMNFHDIRQDFLYKVLYIIESGQLKYKKKIYESRMRS